MLAEEVPQADQQAPPPPGGKGKERKVYQQIQLPSQEQMMWEDFMNNCATRTVMSGVMGMGLGVVFGIVMGSMDSAVTPLPDPPSSSCMTDLPASSTQRACQYSAKYGSPTVAARVLRRASAWTAAWQPVLRRRRCARQPHRCSGPSGRAAGATSPISMRLCAAIDRSTLVPSSSRDVTSEDPVS